MVILDRCWWPLVEATTVINPWPELQLVPQKEPSFDLVHVNNILDCKSLSAADRRVKVKKEEDGASRVSIIRMQRAPPYGGSGPECRRTRRFKLFLLSFNQQRWHRPIGEAMDRWSGYAASDIRERTVAAKADLKAYIKQLMKGARMSRWAEGFVTSHMGQLPHWK